VCITHVGGCRQPKESVTVLGRPHAPRGHEESTRQELLGRLTAPPLTNALARLLNDVGGNSIVMDEQMLATYLDDHLAAATGAIRIAERVAHDHEGTAFGDQMLDLTRELEADRAALGDVRKRLEFEETLVKKAVGLSGAFFSWARDRTPVSSTPSLLEDLETLAIGVWGKRLLWGTLGRVAKRDPNLDVVDLELFSLRAEAQERELLRIRADAILDELELEPDPSGPPA
jgi:hypothetical protein